MFPTENLAVNWRLLRGRKWIYSSRVKTSDTKIVFFTNHEAQWALPTGGTAGCYNTLITNIIQQLYCTGTLLRGQWITDYWLFHEHRHWAQRIRCKPSMLKCLLMSVTCYLQLLNKCRQIKPKPGVGTGSNLIKIGV